MLAFYCQLKHSYLFRLSLSYPLTLWPFAYLTSGQLAREMNLTICWLDKYYVISRYCEILLQKCQISRWTEQQFWFSPTAGHKLYILSCSAILNRLTVEVINQIVTSKISIVQKCCLSAFMVVIRVDVGILSWIATWHCCLLVFNQQLKQFTFNCNIIFYLHSN